jgi:hypothetical protein
LQVINQGASAPTGANMKIVLTQEQLEKILKEYFDNDYNIKINEIVFAANVEQFCTIYTRELQ